MGQREESRQWGGWGLDLEYIFGRTCDPTELSKLDLSTHLSSHLLTTSSRSLKATGDLADASTHIVTKDVLGTQASLPDYRYIYAQLLHAPGRRSC